MSDLISRSALIEFARNHFGGEIDCNDIARFPTIDTVPRWIPVEERLPEELTDVLTKCGHGAAWFYGLAHLFEGKWKVDGIGGSVDIVTHWMPLPEPPEEVRHE